nr:transcription initiation factor tfiid subunit 3 [Quercus suber]
MSSQSHDLHRALLRPFIVHTLRAAGFHSTRPSVLDTLTNLAERHLQLLGASVAALAQQAHNEPVPTVSDVRLALAECGVLGAGAGSASEEAWREMLRTPVAALAAEGGGEARARREKRKRDDADAADVRELTGWVDGRVYAEIKRVAGRGSGVEAVGVGGEVVQVEDFLTGLKRKLGKGGIVDDGRWVGTVLGYDGEGGEVLVEGGPVGRLRDWRPSVQRVPEKADVEEQGAETNGTRAIDAVG